MKNSNPECVCGHRKSDHIHEEGSCRPGYECKARCRGFVERTILRQRFILARSGLSLDAGNIRIRFEAAGTQEERQQLATGISALPDLIAACEAALAQDSGLACADILKAALEKAGVRR